jgi:hypothetical protein
MTALATVEDVAFLSGVPVPDDDRARVEWLIEHASAAVEAATVPLPDEVPTLVAGVVATVVVRVMANPTQASSEALGSYRVGYFGAKGLGLTDAELEQLGPWARPAHRNGSVWTPSPFAVDPFAEGFIDFGRDDALVIVPDEDYV